MERLAPAWLITQDKRTRSNRGPAKARTGIVHELARTPGSYGDYSAKRSLSEIFFGVAAGMIGKAENCGRSLY
jgi:hypothetical protein